MMNQVSNQVPFAEQVESDRAARDVVAVEFTSEFLPQFIEWLNGSHIVRDNYLYTFGLHWVTPTQAVIEDRITTFNDE